MIQRGFMEENCIITIRGVMENCRDEESDSVELTTRGNFTLRGEAYYITYAESSATGYAGCTTTVKVAQDGRKVSMLRYGPTPGQLVIEKGVRHLCHYETGYGALSLGISADEITPALSRRGGKVSFSYILESETESISKNSVEIRVKPI